MNEINPRPLPLPGWTKVLAAVVLGVVAAIALATLAPERSAAQVPPPTEEQAQSIERQLMCPQCPNERLDTCDRAVCRDMKRIIREQLEDGRTPDDIILFFEMRYGPRVRASLPAEGFNLWLYGWIGAAFVAVAGGGGWYMWRLRRHATTAGAPPAAVGTGRDDHRTPDEDDEWLDAQLRSNEQDDR